MKLLTVLFFFSQTVTYASTTCSQLDLSGNWNRLLDPKVVISGITDTATASIKQNGSGQYTGTFVYNGSDNEVQFYDINTSLSISVDSQCRASFEYNNQKISTYAGSFGRNANASTEEKNYKQGDWIENFQIDLNRSTSDKIIFVNTVNQEEKTWERN